MLAGRFAADGQGKLLLRSRPVQGDAPGLHRAAPLQRVVCKHLRGACEVCSGTWGCCRVQSVPSPADTALPNRYQRCSRGVCSVSITQSSGACRAGTSCRRPLLSPIPHYRGRVLIIKSFLSVDLKASTLLHRFPQANLPLGRDHLD